MSSRDRPNLLAMLDAVSRIARYTEKISSADEYYESSVIFDATLMNFVVIGEMVDRLSSELKEKQADIDW